MRCSDDALVPVPSRRVVMPVPSSRRHHAAALLPSSIVPPTPSRRLAVSPSFAQPSCATIIITSIVLSSQVWLLSLLAPWNLVKLTFGDVAPHHRITISLPKTCAILFDADSGPGKPTHTLGSHAVPLCRMMLVHHAPRATFRMRGCCHRCCCHSLPRLATTASRPHAAHGRC